MNKKVYLSNLEWVKTHDNMGGVKAEIVFNDNMTYDEYKELHDKTYYVLTDTNLEEKWNNLRNDIEKELAFCTNEANATINDTKCRIAINYLKHLLDQMN